MAKPNINGMIQYMVDLKNRGITYSMTGSRNGTDGTGDCSGTVVEAIFRSGGEKYDWLFNTDSMHAYLLELGFVCVAEGKGSYSPKRGDVFIWGVRGQSGGAFGHTGIFYDDSENIIHCNYGYNGVTINNVDLIWNANGQPYYYIYRLNGSNPQPSKPEQPQKPKPPVNQEKRRFGYRVDDVQFVNGIWQVKNNFLCQAGFTWNDNGIPAIDIDMIDPATGNMLANQDTIQVGQYFAFNPNRVKYVGHSVSENGRTYRSINTSYGAVYVEYRTSQAQLIYG